MGSGVAYVIGVIVLAQVHFALAATSQVTASADTFVSSANPANITIDRIVP